MLYFNYFQIVSGACLKLQTTRIIKPFKHAKHKFNIIRVGKIKILNIHAIPLNQEGLQNKQIYLLGFKNAFLLVEDRKCYAIFYAKFLKDFHLP